MRIKLIKTSQAVQFEKKSETSFYLQPEWEARNGRPPYTMQEQENGCVIIRSANCLVKINPANIAYIEYDLASEEVATVSKKSK